MCFGERVDANSLGYIKGPRVVIRYCLVRYARKRLCSFSDYSQCYLRFSVNQEAEFIYHSTLLSSKIKMQSYHIVTIGMLRRKTMRIIGREMRRGGNGPKIEVGLEKEDKKDEG